jgi:hypothetical protein
MDEDREESRHGKEEQDDRTELAKHLCLHNFQLPPQQVAQFRRDHRNPFIGDRRLAFLHPQVADAQVDEIGEAAELHGLLRAVAIATVHHKDPVGSARIDLDQLDFPGDSREAKHLRIARLVERPNGTIADLGDIRRAGAREYQVCIS